MMHQETVVERHGQVRSDWLRSALMRCPVFPALDEGHVEKLVSACSAARFQRRGILLEQGGVAGCLYVLATGRVRVVRQASDSRVLTVAYRAAGDLLGETALSTHDETRASSTASATEPVEAVRIPLATMRSMLEEQPSFAQSMLGLMVDRRLEAERRVESLLSRSVESRVAEFLVDAAERYGVPDPRGVLISIRYTHQEIADYVGSTRETVTLTLGALRKEGLLDVAGRRLIVKNRERLVEKS